MTINTIILGLLAVIAVSTIPALAEYLSPLKQIQMGIEPDDILCNADRVHAIRDNGNHVCVTEATAQRLGWIVLADDAARTTEPPAERGILQAPARTITVTPQFILGHSILLSLPYFPNSTTYTYPEQITMGVPFTINYTYTYEGSRESVPQVWNSENSEIWPTHVNLWMDKEIALYTDGFVAKPMILEIYDVATTEEYIQKAPYGGYYLTKYVPFNNTGIQSGSITLQVYGKDGKEYHDMSIWIDEYPQQNFFIYVDGQTGHILTKKEITPSDHIKYLEKLGITASEQQVVDSLGGVAGSSALPDYESPFSDKCTEHVEWDSLDADERLWHILYYYCLLY